MSNILAIANAKFNQAVAAGTPTADVYIAIYAQQVTWFNAKKQPHTVTIEELATISELAMREISTLISTYTK